MAASRLPRLLVIALVVLILLWAAALGLLWIGRQRSSFPAAETIDARFSARPGANLTRADLEPDRLDATLADLAARGITYVRFTLPWDEIEPVRGEYDWQAWDAVAGAFARQPALEPVVVLDRSPAWARSAGDASNPMAPPHERRDFGAFARAVAERYRDTFTYYQIWDEPNIAPHWGTKPVDPADYLGLLREAAVNIRAADPGARIVAAALAPTTEGGGANLSDIAYLDELYNLGGRAWFDFPAAQPYGFSEPPARNPDPGRLDFDRAHLLRQVMLRHGDAGTPLWATSFGWNAEAAPGSPFGNVSEAQQAEFTNAAFDRAAREWPWLGPMLWAANFPAAPATREVLARAANPSLVLGPGRHAAGAPALRYRGWRTTLGAADPSADGDTLDFTFNGTGAALEVQGGPYWAHLTATVDGRAANQLPRDEAGESYLVLNDPSAATRLVPLAADLPPGEHDVHLVAHGGWGQWPLRAVVVTPDDSAASSNANRLGLALAALAAVASVVTLGLARRSQDRPVALEAAAGGGVPAEMQTRSLRAANVALWVLAIVLCGVYLLSGSGMLNLAVLALLGLLFLARPELAPPLIAASLPWWQRTQPVLRWQFGLFEALAWVALLAWIGRGVLAWLANRARSSLEGMGLDEARPRSGVSVALDISMVALFVSGLLAALFATEQGVAWREFRIVFLFGLVLYLLITRSSNGAIPVRVAGLVLGLLGGATIASLAGLWQLVSGQGRVDVEGVGRIAAFYGSPNNLALILDRAVPLAAALALFGVSFGRGSGGLAWEERRSVRGMFAAVAAITLAAAVATFSKGAVLLGLPLGMAFVLLGGAWRTGRRWPLWLLLALVAVSGLGLVVLFQTPRFADLFNFEAGTSFFRLKLWRGALNMALDHPLLGVGPDNFLYAYRTHYVLPSAWQELNLSHPHNIFLDLWTRLGIVGVVAGLGALGAAFVSGWRLFASSSRSEPWPLMLGLLAGLAAGVAHGLIDNWLFLPDLTGWFVAALGIFWLSLSVIDRASSQSFHQANRGQ